ncbi:MAG: class I SAM-dependent methyltransferase, partial [Planctomycetota bacterium]
MTDTHDEKAFLESVTHTYVTSESVQDRLIKSLAVRTFKPFIRSDGNGLEFGCSDGYMTSLIAPLCDSLTVVDGSQTFINMASKRVKAEVIFNNSLFEEFNPDNKFDNIFATFALEHVLDAIGFLKHARSLLSDHGLLFIVVPNA